MIRGSAHSLQHRLPGRRRTATTPFLSACALSLTILTAAWPPDVARSAMPGQERDSNLHAAPVGDGLRISPVPCEVRVELGRKGTERLWLAARLRKNGGLIRRPVSWKVHRLDALTGEPREIVAEAMVDIAEFRVPEGDYLIEVGYGYRRSTRRIHVGEGEYVAMTFILDVGGLRPFSRLERLGPVHEVRTVHRIYALNGTGHGRLVTARAGQGELLRLGKGEYRVESRFLPGNARAVSHVRIRPGILSSLEILARAGVVRIRPPVTSGTVRWLVRDPEGPWRYEGQGEGTLVLAPGRYVLTYHLAGRRISRRFTVDAGRNTILEIRTAGAK